MKIKSLTIFMLAAALFLVACGKSDADVQKAATDKLTADKVTGVTVAVKDGVATLTGQVADVTVKSKAEASVKGVEGVKSVTNNITLAPPPTPPPSVGDDQMIKGTVEESLKKANITGVTVTVANGEVTLSGTVSKDNLAKAMQAANATNPKKVNNNLTVK